MLTVVRRGWAKNLPPALEALERLLAVAPLVVAGNEEEAVADALELLLSLEQPRVAAGLRARADVA
jgi:hypothetical protein